MHWVILALTIGFLIGHYEGRNTARREWLDRD